MFLKKRNYHGTIHDGAICIKETIYPSLSTRIVLVLCKTVLQLLALMMMLITCFFYVSAADMRGIGSLVNSHTFVGTHRRTLINILSVLLFTEKQSFVFFQRDNESRTSILGPHLKQTSDFNAACVHHCLKFFSSTV